MKTILIGSGAISDYDVIMGYLDDDAFVIACDGGLKHCREMGITPNLIVGDFDSAESEDKIFYENKGVEIFKYPKKKDMTDMEIGLDIAIEKEPESIFILGGLGSRFDHSLANVHIILKAIKEGISACVLDNNNIITLVIDSIDIEGEVGQNVSLIPLTTEVNGVVTENLEYELNDATLKIGSSIGVSNVMTRDFAKISVKEGILIVIMSRD